MAETPGLPAVSHPEYSYLFPRQHRFAMSKFGLLMEHLNESGMLDDLDLYRPGACPDRWLELAHCPTYIQRFKQGLLSKQELRRMGLPWSEKLVRRSLISPSGTIYTAQLALRHGLACHLAGGTHHAHYDFASGFCILNDLAICSLKLLEQENVGRVLVFDCDVHQGDGTARILKNEDRAFTCSIHCEKNFPSRKAQSNYDVNLPPHLEDDDYIEAVDKALAFCINSFAPDIILYDAGVDIYDGDPLGLLHVSEKGISLRDRLVLETCCQKGIPVATVIGGGYDKDHTALARRHSIVVKESLRLWKSSSH